MDEYSVDNIRAFKSNSLTIVAYFRFYCCTLLSQAKCVVNPFFAIVPQINTVPGLFIFQFHARLCIVSSYVFRRRLELAAQLDRRQWEKKNEGIFKKLITKVTCSCEHRDIFK